MKIIVTGSLGHIGKPLATELVQKGHQVTVISSNPEKQKDIEALGATAAIGSLEDADFLANTFTGADAVFAMEPPNLADPDPLAYYQRLGRNYARALEQTGVRRVVNLSSYGAHLDQGSGFILGSHYVEKILNELSSGPSITHLRPGYFYYNLYSFVGMIKEHGFMAANYGGADTLVLIDPADIAVAAAEELTAADGPKVRYVVGDELTANEAAGILGAAIGKPDLQWLIFTDEQVQEALEKSGMPANIASLFVELGAGIHSGKLDEDYRLNRPAVFGKIKLEDFAKEFAASF